MGRTFACGQSNAPMSICPTRYRCRARNPRGPPIARSSRGPQGEHFTVAASIIGSRTFPVLAARDARVGLDDTAVFERRGGRLIFRRAASVIQSWILTFPDMATLDAQFDEAKIRWAKSAR